MNQQKLDLSAPWHVHRNKVAALFELDEEVTVGAVEQSENGYSLTVRVSNRAKAAALRQILACPEFGGVKLSVIVEDTSAEETPADILRAAFAYNRAVWDVAVNQDEAGGIWTYLVMEPDTVQFYADNLADYRGNMSMLAEQSARDCLVLDAGTAVCTADLREND